MINNITTMDTRPQMAVAKPTASATSMGMPPILGFRTPELKQKATIRVKKLKRGDNIAVFGEIDDDYVDIKEEVVEQEHNFQTNFFAPPPIIKPIKHRVKYLKNCYVIDYIQSPKPYCGLGTEAVKNLAEKAMFDTKADGRIVTFSAPVIKEASPAIFFYKLGFRFTNPDSNEQIEKCIRDKMPDIPAQTGMMYLPKSRLQKLLRYGELF